MLVWQCLQKQVYALPLNSVFSFCDDLWDSIDDSYYHQRLKLTHWKLKLIIIEILRVKYSTHINFSFKNTKTQYLDSCGGRGRWSFLRLIGIYWNKFRTNIECKEKVNAHLGQVSVVKKLYQQDMWRFNRKPDVWYKKMSFYQCSILFSKCFLKNFKKKSPPTMKMRLLSTPKIPWGLAPPSSDSSAEW